MQRQSGSLCGLFVGGVSLFSSQDGMGANNGLAVKLDSDEGGDTVVDDIESVTNILVLFVCSF